MKRRLVAAALSSFSLSVYAACGAQSKEAACKQIQKVGLRLPPALRSLTNSDGKDIKERTWIRLSRSTRRPPRRSPARLSLPSNPHRRLREVHDLADATV